MTLADLIALLARYVAKDTRRAGMRVLLEVLAEDHVVGGSHITVCEMVTQAGDVYVALNGED